MRTKKGSKILLATSCQQSACIYCNQRERERDTHTHALN